MMLMAASVNLGGPLLPTNEDVALYRELGFYVSRVVLEPEVLDEASRGMNRLYLGDRDHPFPPLQVEADVGSAVHRHWEGAHGWSSGAGLRKNDYASLQVDELRTLVHTPVIGAIAARLCGSEVVRLWHDQLIYKPPDGTGTQAAVGWHTDRQYWQMCTSEEMLTAWVPFHDVSEDNGTICFLAGSNHWDDIDGLSFFEHDLARLAERISAFGYAVQPMVIPLRRGQLTFHHCRTIHGSGPNRSDVARRSLSVHLQPDDNRYRPVYGPDGIAVHHVNDYICRQRERAPDYQDPNVCAVLHQPEISAAALEGD